jgi:hypothetical protein
LSSDLIITGNTWLAMKEQCTALVRSGFLPDSIRTPEQAIAIALKGHEIGMPMMQAFSSINIIKGKPTISAEGMNALIRKHCPRAKLEILENDALICTIRATRPGEASFTHSYTMDDARRANITGNPSWTKYPDAMLFARCISSIARRVFPDCLQGISYTPEELGAEVNEDGEIINIKAQDISQDSQEGSRPSAYTYANVEHRKIFAEIAKKYGITTRDDLKRLSDEFEDVPLEELEEGISLFLGKSHGEPQAGDSGSMSDASDLGGSEPL